jgi:hypothetical protein
MLLYTPEADALRAQLRDVFGWRHVDAGDGWLIFESPPAELAFHPAQEVAHELFLICDDIAQTVEELTERGVEFVAPVSDQGFGLETRFRIPGAGELGLYEPRHPSPLAPYSGG